jgi:hypothetical protein
MHKERKPNEGGHGSPLKEKVSSKDVQHKTKLDQIPPVEPNDRKSNRKHSGSEGGSTIERGSNH